MYIQLNLSATAITALAGKYSAEIGVSAAVATDIASQLGVGDWGYLWLRNGACIEVVKVVGTGATSLIIERAQSGTERNAFPAGSSLYSAPSYAGVYDYISANVSALPFNLAATGGLSLFGDTLSFDFGGLEARGRAALTGALPAFGVGLVSSIAPCCPGEPVARLEPVDAGVECQTPLDYAEYDPGPDCCSGGVPIGDGIWWALRANSGGTPVFAVSRDLENWSNQFGSTGVSAAFIYAAYAGAAIAVSHASTIYAIADPVAAPPLVVGVTGVAGGIADFTTEYGGVWIAYRTYSTDNGQTWQQIPNPDFHFGNVVRAPGGRWYLYAATEFNVTKRIWYSDAPTPTGWILLANCPSESRTISNSFSRLLLEIVGNRLLVSATSSGGIKRILYSDNEGAAWTLVSTGIPDSSLSYFTHIRNLGGVVYAWSDNDGRINRSTNNGLSFVQVKNGVDSALSTVKGLFLRDGALVASFSRGGTSANRTNSYSMDYGTTWVDIEHPFTAMNINEYAFIFPGPNAPEGVEVP